MKKKSRHITIVDPPQFPESSTDDVDSKLLQACTFRHVASAREALSRGADVNCRRSDSMTPLHIAAEHGDVDLIQLLCDQPSVNIESKTMHGLMPLHTAASIGNSEAILKLLENGAPVNCVDNLGRYPLHYSALQKDTESARVLLRHDANVNVYDAFHECPLYASVIKSPHLPMVKLLLAYGACSTSAPYKHSFGLLLEAALSAQRMPNMLNIVKILFRRGASVNITDFIGQRTPLHIAAMTGNEPLAVISYSFLIQHGANLKARNRAGRTPMDVAITCQHFCIARLIERALLEQSELRLTQSRTNLINNLHSDR